MKYPINKVTQPSVPETKSTNDKSFFTLFYNGVLQKLSKENTLKELRITELLDRLSNIETNEYKVTYFEIIDITAATTGSIVIPQGATLITTGFSGNSLLSTINGNSYPDGFTPIDADGQSITVNLDTSGNWVSSGNYPDLVAILYQVSILEIDMNNLSTANIIDVVDFSVEFEPKEDTGTDIYFSNAAIFNSPASPGTGNITNDLTNARRHIIQKIYHNDAVIPQAPMDWIKVSNRNYKVSNLNIIYAEWISGNRVEYWIAYEEV